MRKLLTVIFACLTFGCFAQTGAKHDFIRTPNGFNTIVDWNLKAKSFNLPHYLLTARPLTQDSIGTIFLNTNSSDPHIYIKSVVGSVYTPIAYLSDFIFDSNFKRVAPNIALNDSIKLISSITVGTNPLQKIILTPGTINMNSTSTDMYLGMNGHEISFNRNGDTSLTGRAYRIEALDTVTLVTGNHIKFQNAVSLTTLTSIYGVGANGELAIAPFPTSVRSVFGRNGNVVAQSGDYNTSQVTENTNLYFTQARVLATPITGFVSQTGALLATDPILVAIEKLNGNIAASVTGVSSFNTRGGAVVPVAGDYASLTETLTNKTLTSGTNTFPTFNQNTTGSAATLTTSRNINGVGFNGSANITITANTPNSLTNGFGIKTLSFNGSTAPSVVVDSSKVSTIVGLVDTINAHGATAGYGINPTQFALGNVVVDTTSVASKAWGFSAFFTKNQILTNNFIFTSFHAHKDSTSAVANNTLFSLSNNFISTASTDLFSPALRFRTHLFNASTDKVIDFLMRAEGNSSTTVGQFMISDSLAGGTRTDLFLIDRFGNVNIKSANATMTITNGNLAFGTAGNHITFTEGSGGYKGQTTLVSGTKAITITGLTTSNRAFISFVSIGGTVTTTWQYAGVCTSNTLTITALTNTGSTDTTDTSILNYVIY